jgi:hypothetical protein
MCFNDDGDVNDIDRPDWPCEKDCEQRIRLPDGIPVEMNVKYANGDASVRFIDDLIHLKSIQEVHKLRNSLNKSAITDVHNEIPPRNQKLLRITIDSRLESTTELLINHSKRIGYFTMMDRRAVRSTKSNSLSSIRLPIIVISDLWNKDEIRWSPFVV